MCFSLLFCTDEPSLHLCVVLWSLFLTSMLYSGHELRCALRFILQTACFIICYSALAQNTYAYVTSSDVRSIKELDERTVVAIKAPSQTKLEISDPDEVAY